MNESENREHAVEHFKKLIQEEVEGDGSLFKVIFQKILISNIEQAIIIVSSR